jgi:hypothetical protein
VRASTAARLVSGTASLGAPGLLLRSCGAPDHDDPLVRALARLLGLRLLVQGLLDLARPGRSHGLDVTLDLSHAVSMLPVPGRWPSHARAAWLSACLTTTIAVTDLVQRPG